MPMSGSRTEDLTPSLAQALGYKVDHGALIVAVNGGSPAERAGSAAARRMSTCSAARCRPAET